MTKTKRALVFALLTGLSAVSYVQATVGFTIQSIVLCFAGLVLGLLAAVLQIRFKKKA
ncbi:hypothetical protein [uncultured Microbacterium sp.]|uniref:hypothetical protein n=1 Tax=uncultured Microbacterium sp. TaxID=191216 RepID=UPI0028D84618|nr:hypothetical protein [uncultured Microbacterium sp.]